MKTCLCLAALAGLLAGCSFAPARGTQESDALVKSVIVNWSKESQVSALKLIDEYGPPDRIEAGQLVWEDRDPWKRTSVWDAETNSDPIFGPVNLEQTAAYPVTSDQRKALEAFSDRIRVDKTGTELSARYNSEELNFLAINLADEVIRGLRSPEDARRFFGLTIELGAAGKSSIYMQGLLFDWRRWKSL